MQPDALPAAARCAVHPESFAVGTCVRCGDFMCPACAVSERAGHCSKCAPKQVNVVYFPVTTARFVTMSLATFGLYQIYWGYRCWKYVNSRDGSALWPAFLRAMFLGFTYFGLVKEVAMTSLLATGSPPPPQTALSRMPSGLRTLLALGFLLTTMCWRLPEPYDLISMTSFLFLLPTVFSIRQLNEARGVPLAEWGMRTRHRLMTALGLLLLAAAIYGAFVPDSHASS